MGVTKLWTIVEDSGKPVRLETLKKKRLAVDASIWVYQFLKAVRNKEGQGLKGSHIVGFFRRICKLLYHGVLPVFVFDGGAPVLKLNTIAKRRERREGQRQSAKGTAQKLLLMKMQQEAEKHVEKEKNYNPKKGNSAVSESDITLFRKEDDYHLPEIDKFYHKKSDKRIISADDYRKYMESLDDDIGELDLNNIDPGSDEFNELPLEKQYKILHRLRLRSRLRMGYSKEQLQDIFPNSLDFSKFQIQMVTKRNFLTQKLLNVVGLDDSLPDVDSVSTTTRRMAGENDRAYTLQRNKDGWSLSLDNQGTEAHNAINLDEDDEEASALSKINQQKRKHRSIDKEDGEDDEDDDFSDMEWEDVKIEAKKPRQNFSLNALPLPPASEHQLTSDNSRGAFFTLNQSKQKEERKESGQIEEAFYDKAVEESINDRDEEYQRELKKAIEVSKQELAKLQKEQEDFLEEDLFEIGGDNKVEEKVDANVATNQAPLFKAPTISLGKSMFQKKKDTAKAAAPKPQPKVAAKEVKDDFDESFSEDDFDDVAEAKPEKKVSNEVPDWFARKDNDFQDIHRSGFVASQISKPVATDVKSVDEEKKAVEQEEAQKEEDEDGLVEHFHYDEDQKRYTGAVDEDEDQQVVELPDEAGQQVIEVGDDTIESIQNGSDLEIVEAADEKPEKAVTKEPVAGEPVAGEPATIEKPKKQVLFEQAKPTVEEIRKLEIPRIEGIDTAKSDNASLAQTVQSLNGTRDNVSENGTVTQDSVAVNGKTSNDQDAIQNTQNKITYYDFEEDEENEIADDLRKEEEAHEEFTQNLRQQYQPAFTSGISSYNEASLREQQKRELRDSDEVTDVMIEEVKDLLTCFGIPYITAPMEAEAQCAKLFTLGLVDGIVTDDSDCFLFGGDKIYRHMFTEKKFAELYETKDLEKKLNLDRDKLIELAYLLGSDYTEGLKGIGPVIAVKILNEFGDLTSFRDWCMQCQAHSDQNSPELKKLCHNSFRKSLRKRLVNNETFLDNRFPDPQVRKAYLHPEVDEDKTNFVWGAPDLDMLRNYLGSKVGWSKEKINHILVPLIRRYNSPW